MGCYLNGSGGSRVNTSVTHRNQATAVLQGGGGGRGGVYLVPGADIRGRAVIPGR